MGIPTKLSKLKAAAAAGDWNEALRIAARFPRLGEHKVAILRAHEVANGHGARTYAQLGHDPDVLIADGIEALTDRYNLNGETTMTKTKAPAKKKAPTAKAKATAKAPAAPEPEPKKTATKAPASPTDDETRKYRGAWRERYDMAKAGKLPTPPDFTAETHRSYRKKLDSLIKLADDRDLDGLKGFPIKVYCSSTRPLDQYRNLCVMALTG